MDRHEPALIIDKSHIKSSSLPAAQGWLLPIRGGLYFQAAASRGTSQHARSDNQSCVSCNTRRNTGENRKEKKKKRGTGISQQKGTGDPNHDIIIGVGVEMEANDILRVLDILLLLYTY